AVSSNEKSVSRDEEKIGTFTEKYAVNPLTGDRIQIWETNYVASDYGTGAIMGVPAYDERDMEFAKKYKIDVVKKPFDKTIEKKAVEEGWGKKDVNYHIRDWLISRQRYWGCPIPMIYCESCASNNITFKGEPFKGMAGWFPVSEDQLPVKLPEDVDFLPHGESPIARSKTFQAGAKCPECGKQAKREVDTMDTYVDSSWYFIRFVDPKNTKVFASDENIKDWLPVDIYVGGGHVVQHLLFARFFWKFLFDEGLIDKSVGDEPFIKLRAPGWILGEDSRKMSKRWGNVVTPDDILPKFGADTLRVYEMFMGPFDVMKPWSMAGVEGTHRFLGRVWRLFNHESGIMNQESNNEINIKLHQTIKKVTEDIEEMKFNTAISSIMELVNTLTEFGRQKTEDRREVGIWPECLRSLALLLAPFAPHLAEELWVEVLDQPFSIHKAAWPRYDDKYLQVDTLTIAIQINGKLRATLSLTAKLGDDKEAITKLAMKDANVSKWLKDQKIKNTVFVPGKLVNFVV
ncbi:MAG: class I tRNA ligase family protein, partial [bacterium]|nr:class I tRNA ligase family protein [bacterium]